MSIFNKLKAQAETVTTTDVDAKVTKFTLDSGVYPAKIRVAYLDSYASGAIFVALDAVVTKEDGKEVPYKERICISNKEGSLTYTAKDGKVRPLPGYMTIDALCQAGTGTEFSGMSTEMKKIKVWNAATRQEEPADREVLMDLVGVKLELGILEEKEDHYANAGETILRNKIAKVFTEEGKTISETRAKLEGVYKETWNEKYKGNVIDRTSGAKKTPNGSPASNSTEAPMSLF